VTSRSRSPVLLPEADAYLTIFTAWIKHGDVQATTRFPFLTDLRRTALDDMVEKARERNDREQTGPKYAVERAKRKRDPYINS
jgi:hypothetical protein